MNPESLKCSQAVRTIQLERFRLSRDGRKWKQAARSRSGLLLRLASYANGDGTFERDGRNYSPSEKTITKHIATNTYYCLSNDLRELGWLSWTREQKHYGRRLFTIHLENHLPDSPEHLPPAEVITSTASGNNPSLPNTRSAQHEAAPEQNSERNNTQEEASEARAGEQSTYQNSPYSREARAANPSIPPNPTEGRIGLDHLVSKNDDEAEPITKWEVVPTAAEIECSLLAEAQRKAAIEKGIEWRKRSKDIKDHVNVVVKRCAAEWEYWATHDDGEVLEGRRYLNGHIDDDNDGPRVGSFPCPTEYYKNKLAEKLETYTDRQVLQAWIKLLRRQQGFGGLDYATPWTLFLGDSDEFGIYVEDGQDSQEPEEPARDFYRRYPPIEAFVNALDAKRDDDGWIAKCPFSSRHRHGDSNPSLVISVGEKQPVTVHCRGGCDQHEVWNLVLEKARSVSLDDLPPLTSYAPKPKADFNPIYDIVAILHRKLGTVPAVQAWMKEFGITPEVADRLQLGAVEKGLFKKVGESPAVVTPHYDLSGRLIGLKARAVPVKDFTQEEGSSIDGLFAVAHLDLFAEEVLVLEGDKDVAIAMSHGFNVTGILSADSRLSDADIALLAKYKRIYLIGDQDLAGVQAMNHLAIRLPEKQTIRVRLPAKDVGELFQQYRSDFKSQLTAILGRDPLDRSPEERRSAAGGQSEETCRTHPSQPIDSKACRPTV